MPSVSARFQFTRPRGARRWFCWRSGRCRGFNSRARVGRDQTNNYATGGGKFQFTRPRGARRRRTARRPSAGCFNSRARVGRDRVFERGGRCGEVSIHAPAWGATRRGLPGRLGQDVSIHAPAWGATRRDAMQDLIAEQFQFTRPRGARPCERETLRAFGWFQFTRPRGARRGVLEQDPDEVGVSIHAPAWGATISRRPPAPPSESFNSRARVGRDP